ncbi:hypothetical protein BJF90_17460 [Pseudonocardia sp. CNS-004]|nr:hypothetical protein BJF90_17460 [Pseudonocardia sp. CNS-004]
MDHAEPSVTLLVDFRFPPAPRQPARIAHVEWTAPGSGAAGDRWLVGVVLDPSDGGPPIRHEQTVASHGSRSRHVIEVEIDGPDAGPAAATYRGIATLSRRSTPADAGSVAGFTELGTFRFHPARHDPDTILTELRRRRRPRAPHI